MCFTARPRVGGRRAVGQWRRGGPRRGRPQGPAPYGRPAAPALWGRAVTRLDSLLLDSRRSLGITSRDSFFI